MVPLAGRGLGGGLARHLADARSLGGRRRRRGGGLDARGAPALGAVAGGGHPGRRPRRRRRCARVPAELRVRSRPLAGQQAAVAAELLIRTDLHASGGSGFRGAYGTARATLVEVAGRGETNHLRAPVLVVVTGAALEPWSRLPVGSRVEVSGRLEAPDRGSDLAAIVRVRVGAAPGAAGRGAAAAGRTGAPGAAGRGGAPAHRAPRPGAGTGAG